MSMELDTIHNTDALTLLRALPDESINCCVTSPPYFGLRDYGTDGQIGLEETPQQYVDALVTVFRELRRVLRSDGVAWLNIGDSYAGSGKGGQSSEKRSINWQPEYSNHGARYGFKAKDRMLIPARLAIALQDDGWWLRDEIVWHKPNPMPSSVTDRTTTAHEMIYLLTKSPRYWYDAEAVAEPAVGAGGGDFMRTLTDVQPEHGGESRTGNWARSNRPKSDKQALVGKRTYTGFNERWANSTPSPTRNLRSVWTINTEAFPASHFAVMPSKLVEICILAGCPPKVCSACGAPYQRVDDGERTLDTSRSQARRALELFEEKGLTDDHLKAIRAVGLADAGKALVTMNGAGKNTAEQQRLADEAKAALGGYYREFLFGSRSSNGWTPTCDCHAPHDSGIVIDPFMGAGTVALVAQRLNRHFIGSDLNPEYVRMATMRVQGRLDEYLAEQRGEPHTAYMFTEGAQP
jgi:DNA modification methylase